MTYKVKNPPALFFFGNDKSKPLEYKVARSYTQLRDFLTYQTVKKHKMVDQAVDLFDMPVIGQRKVIDIDDDNYRKILLEE